MSNILELMTPSSNTVTPWWRLCLSLPCCWIVQRGPMWLQDRLNMDLGHLTGLNRHCSLCRDITCLLVTVLHPSTLFGQNTREFFFCSDSSNSSAMVRWWEMSCEPHLGQDSRDPPTALQEEQMMWLSSQPCRGMEEGVVPHTAQTRK